MKTPGFFQGVCVAAALALAASIFTTVFCFSAIVRVLIPALSLAYLLYLFGCNTVHTGRPTTLALWSAMTLLAWWVAPAPSAYLMIHVGALWLVRSLYFHSGLLAALADLAIAAFGVIALAWAMFQTGSIFLGTWCFFLVQAVFVAIPRSLDAKPPAVAEDEAFQRARNAAQAALSRLIQQ